MTNPFGGFSLILCNSSNNLNVSLKILERESTFGKRKTFLGKVGGKDSAALAAAAADIVILQKR